MSKYIDWEFIPIEKEYVDKVKKQGVDWKENFKSNVDTRWTGRIGEEAFRRMMAFYKRPVIDYTQDGPSWIDFRYLDLKIDVKTLVMEKSKFIREDYVCNITPKQHYQNKEVDTYVFCRYVVPLGQVAILGYYPKDQFEKDAILKDSRTTHNNSGSLHSEGEHFELEISYLYPISNFFMP